MITEADDGEGKGYDFLSVRVLEDSTYVAIIRVSHLGIGTMIYPSQGSNIRAHPGFHQENASLLYALTVSKSTD